MNKKRAGNWQVPPQCLLTAQALLLPFPQEFEQDALEFQQKVQDIDRRLATVFSQAFSDAPGLEHIFKVCLSLPSLSLSPTERSDSAGAGQWGRDTAGLELGRAAQTCGFRAGSVPAPHLGHRQQRPLLSLGKSSQGNDSNQVFGWQELPWPPWEVEEKLL